MIQDNEQYNSLLAIEAKRMELQKKIDESEKKVTESWHKLFHDDMPKPVTPAQKLMAIASNSIGIIDGAILGWKLYKKFKR